jgi:hypothetical protein
MPELPDGLPEEQRQRYETIAAIARKTAARLPRPTDKALEPAYRFTQHLPVETSNNHRRPRT